MNNVKKYIYPFVFSIFWLCIWGILFGVLLKDADIGGIGVGVVFIVLLLCVFIPQYCVMYSKRVIHNEKRKYVFAF